MTVRQEVKAKSMELALSFMGLINELPIANKMAMSEGLSDKELERTFNSAIWWSKRFEEFINGVPNDFQEPL
jgi:hypothetical protein